jgi:hypothetical protein
MDLRLHGVPGAILRRARSRAAREDTDLRAILMAALTAYAEETDSLSQRRRGGQARQAQLTDAERSAAGQRAARARWPQTD